MRAARLAPRRIRGMMRATENVRERNMMRVHISLHFVGLSYSFAIDSLPSAPASWLTFHQDLVREMADGAFYATLNS